jgi:hypothetical protein
MWQKPIEIRRWDEAVAKFWEYPALRSSHDFATWGKLQKSLANQGLRNPTNDRDHLGGRPLSPEHGTFEMIWPEIPTCSMEPARYALHREDRTVQTTEQPPPTPLFRGISGTIL